MKRVNGRWLSAGLVSLMGLLILTHWPLEKMPVDLNRFGLDKIAHTAVYAGLAWLFFKAVTPGRTFLGWVGVVFGLAAIAMLDEFTQTFVNRQSSLFDFAADVIGILGVFIFIYPKDLSEKPATKNDANPQDLELKS